MMYTRLRARKYIDHNGKSIGIAHLRTRAVDWQLWDCPDVGFIL